MRTLRLFPLAIILPPLAACVTINVYFPAVAAERAADRIIEDVWGDRPPAENGSNGPAPNAAPGETQPRSATESSRPVLTWGRSVLEALIPAARAAQPNIDISSPAIRNLTRSMERRHQDLRAYYDSGAIGLTNDALIAVRDLGAVALAQRGRVRQLVAAENQDRNALYREIARANDHPEWESDIRDVFARRWIDKAADGWFYQNERGDWVRR